MEGVAVVYVSVSPNMSEEIYRRNFYRELLKETCVVFSVAGFS